MDISQLEQLVVSALEDIKAKDIQVIDSTRLTSLFDRVVVASGDSNRQTRALARHVADKAREAGLPVFYVPGEHDLLDEGEAPVDARCGADEEFA